MAQSSYPFENIDTSETEFSQMFRNFASGVSGVSTGTELKVTAGTGLQTSVALGQAMVRGHYYISTGTELLTHGAASGSNPRIDSVVLTLDPAVNSIVLAVVAGTPASSPVAPTLTQTDAGVFQYELAQVLIPTSATSVSTITDKRTFMGTRFGVWTTAGRPAAPVLGQAGYNSTTAAPEYWTGSAWSGFSSSVTSINASIIDTTVTAVTGTYTLLAGDKGKLLQSTSATAYAFTVADVFTAGQRVDVIQDGAGQITFTAGSGVTLAAAGGKLKTNVQYSAVTIVCIGTGLYRLIGDLAA